MKKYLFVALVLGVLTAAVVPACALQFDRFTYCGYTVTVTPDDPEQPCLSGTITIVNDEGTVNLEGTYEVTSTRPPTLTVSLMGTIDGPEGTQVVEREFTFEPRTKRMVWKSIIAWIESLLAG
jgi:hypothetical protein